MITRTRGKTHTVVVDGSAGLAQAEELHACLLRAVQAAPVRIAVDLSAVNHIDASAVQLLLAATQSASAKGIELVVLCDPEVLSAAVGGADALSLAIDAAVGLTSKKGANQ